jgi:hypothetical protein
MEELGWIEGTEMKINLDQKQADTLDPIDRNFVFIVVLRVK